MQSANSSSFEPDPTALPCQQQVGNLDTLYSDANNGAYDREIVVRRKQIAHNMKSSSLMLVMDDVSELAGQLEDASMEELEVPLDLPTLLRFEFKFGSLVDCTVVDPLIQNDSAAAASRPIYKSAIRPSTTDDCKCSTPWS